MTRYPVPFGPEDFIKDPHGQQRGLEECNRPCLRGQLDATYRLIQVDVNVNTFRVDDSVWDATVFTKNRQRLLQGNIADAFFAAVLKQARQRDLLSDEHFTVDGTLLEAWAGQKSFRRVDDNEQPPASGTREELQQFADYLNLGVAFANALP